MYPLYNKTQHDVNVDELVKDAYQRGFHAGFQAGVNKSAERVEQHRNQGYEIISKNGVGY